MTRQRRSTRRRPAKAMFDPWDATWHERLFRLASPDWTPPAKVQVRATLKGGTMVGVFIDEDGRSVRLTTRVAVDWKTNACRIVDERMAITFKAGA